MNRIHCRAIFSAFLLAGLLGLASSAHAQWRERNAVTAVAQTDDGLLLTQKYGATRISVNTDALLHVVYSPDASFPKAEDYAIVKHDWAKTPFAVEQNEKEVILKTSKLKVVVNRETAQIDYFPAAGGPKLLADGDRWLEPNVVNGEKVMRSEAFFPIYGSPEAIYGLGQHQAGVWNYRGADVELSQENSEIAIPFWLSTNGYGVYWNNNSRSRWNNRFSNYLYVSSEVAETVDYYFIYGPEFDQIVATYREMTGAAPMFGKWAYGFWQCKNRYRQQSELTDIIRRYRSEHIPVDNIVQDWFWWNYKGEMKFNSNYPDPKGMIDELHKNNAHLMISVWPYFEKDDAGSVYQTMDEKGWLFSDRYRYNNPPFHRKGMAAYDATNPEARKFYWDNINQNLFKLGADAWWMDTVEPETEGAQENIMLHNHLYAGLGYKVANLYPLLTEQGVYQGQRAASSEKRVFILGRSAFAGTQRNAVAVWSGDVIPTWTTFKRQISAGMNYEASGLPYWTTDIGGFTAAFNESPAYRELLTRWFQFGVFNPIFRIHGTRYNNKGQDGGNELWSYGPDTQKILVAFDRLRYRFMPYIYSVAWKTTSEGYTPMRALVFDYRADERAQATDDEYLFGPSVLAAPVTEPGVGQRSVYLPQGGWRDFWTGESVKGGRYLLADAPIDRIPLYVKDGAILPLGPEIEWAMQKSDPIELRIYRGADGSFNLYEDEGDNYNYEKGAHSIIPIRWDDAKQSVTFGARVGSFPGMPEKHTFRIILVDRNRGAGAEPSSFGKVVEYTGAELSVKP